MRTTDGDPADANSEGVNLSHPPNGEKTATDSALKSEEENNSQKNEKEVVVLETEILQELRLVREQLEAINHHRLLAYHNTTFRFLMFNLVRGIAAGLGTVMGATIVVSWAVYFLSKVELLPIVGVWIKTLIDYVQTGP
ncbi:MAG: hypothetical protein HQL50_05780 [Magnetococcales bacterium]|nr:hypothetical protein [Magnetococcales bacterium]